MRAPFAAAALAAFVLAVPAAAQPDAATILNDAFQQIARNAAEVEDYTLVLSSGTMRGAVYVYRDGDEWAVEGQSGSAAAGLFETLVAWPSFGDLFDPDEEEITTEELEELAGAVSVTSATIHGRPAHVVFISGDAMMIEDEEFPDSMRLFVDRETRQLLRVQVSASAGFGDMPDLGEGGMHVTFDFADYRETEGLTVPRRLRMEMRTELSMTEEERQALLEMVAAAREELEGDTSDEARDNAMLMDIVVGLFTEGRVELNVAVEEVQVNSGPPEWLD